MKRFYFLTFILIGLGFLNAQNFEVSKLDGTVLNDGAQINLTTASYPDAKIHFHTTNTSSTEIKMAMKVYEMTNADGSMMETCYGGTCVSSVTSGQVIPSNGTIIQPGSNNGDNDFWFNTATQSTTNSFPIKYVFEFYQIDAFGNPSGDPVYITYNYYDELGVEDIDNPNQKIGVQLISNSIKESIQVKAEIPTQMNVYSLEGKLILNQSLTTGLNAIPFTSQKRGVYLITFTNEKGQFSNKILKL